MQILVNILACLGLIFIALILVAAVLCTIAFGQTEEELDEMEDEINMFDKRG